ncbi:hypothetical protein HBI68_247160 [Parastagonospora nodorum]|nr:hypothetical protein HBI51_246170 [Parastagonospora nodorum]KAH6134219.1 hypothetical protein HBI68_247160 [Parastagonospora nodorum]KAH6384008.1 hypothetical protein HBI60_250980 [Parastagonospora nodorum]KAH6517013.1 hypothetical protein HBI07_246350 [Parastagonospora nodorum]
MAKRRKIKDSIAAKRKIMESCLDDPDTAEDEIVGADPPLNIELEGIPESEPTYEVVTKEGLIEEPTSDIELEEAFMDEPAHDIELEEALITETTHEIASQEAPIAEPMDKVATEEAPIAELKDLSVTEESKNGLFTSSGLISQQPREWSYTKPPVELLIGPNKIVHYVPRRFLSPEWNKAGPERQWYLPNLTLDTGHTLAHYLHTGAYETIDIQIESPVITPFMKLKRALLVYFASTDCGLLGLQHLAMSDMTKHAVEMDLIDFLRAIKNDFNKFGPVSWVHTCLHRKSKAAFEEDHTVFRSEAFLGNLENPTVNRYMMKCVTELYENRVSEMLRREKKLSESLEDCHQTIQVLSEKQDVSEQGIVVQEDFITPEFYDNQTVQDDVVTDEDFCTISCPSSECPNESPEEFTICPPEGTEHPEDAKTYFHNTAPAESMPCEQSCSSTHLAPECSVNMIQAPTVPINENKLKGNHLVPALNPPKELVSLQSKVDAKNETKKQKKLRQRKEKQEMRALWEATKWKRLVTTEENNNEPGQMGVHATNLLAALTAMINDVQPVRASPDIQETSQASPSLSDSSKDMQPDRQDVQEQVEVNGPTHSPSPTSYYHCEKAATKTAEGTQKLRRSPHLEEK